MDKVLVEKSQRWAKKCQSRLRGFESILDRWYTRTIALVYLGSMLYATPLQAALLINGG